MRSLLLDLGLTLALACGAGCASAVTLHGDDWQRVRGTWMLDDGHEVSLAGTRRHPRAEFDDGRSAPLVAVSATDWRTVDGCTLLRFEVDANATLVRLALTRLCR